MRVSAASQTVLSRAKSASASPHGTDGRGREAVEPGGRDGFDSRDDTAPLPPASRDARKQTSRRDAAEGGMMASKTTTERLERLCWRSKLTGFEGHGLWQLSSLVKSALELSKKDYGDILEHWVEVKS